MLNRLTAVYATWLDEDDLGQRYVEVCGPEQDAGATSVRQFLEDLLRLSSGPDAQIERPAALAHHRTTRKLPLMGTGRRPSAVAHDCPVWTGPSFAG